MLRNGIHKESEDEEDLRTGDERVTKNMARAGK
jgi:hypothetical protein